MAVKALLVSLLLLTVLGYRLPIQSHSFNDLDYLSNIIGKGVDHYKIDVSMANRQSCQKHSTWNNSSKCIRTTQFIEDVCCLALRGDASSMLSFDYPFNTSQEYIKFLDAQMARIVAFQPNRTLLFAINFQYDFFFDDSLTEGFLSALVDVMARYPKNLLIGTGSDNFILEYDRICFGKGAPECTDVRRKISKSNLFLQSGAMHPSDPRDHYKRYRNFNTFYKAVDELCKNGFPDWIDNHPEFPLIFWEPSSEQQIQYTLGRLTSPSCMKLHGRSLSGLAIATNIDPEMFELYMKKTVQSNASSWSPASQKLFVNEVVNIRMTKIKDRVSEAVYTAGVTLFSNKLVLQKWEYDSKSQKMRPTSSKQYAVILAAGESLLSLLHDDQNRLYLITNKNNLNMDTIYVFSTTNFALLTSKQWVRAKAACVRGNELIYVVCNQNEVNCTIKGAVDLQQTKTYANLQTDLFLSRVTSIETYGSNGFILVGQASTKTDLVGAVFIENSQIVPPLGVLGYGQNPKILKKQTGRQFAVVLSDSMCTSGVLINNNGMNKCTFYRQTQFQSLKNVEGLVNLIEFNVNDLKFNEQVVTACHPKLFHTKLMNGANTEIVELTSLGSYLIGSEYVPVQSQDLMASLFCGPSNFDLSLKYKQRSSILSTLTLPPTPNSPSPTHSSIE